MEIANIQTYARQLFPDGQQWFQILDAQDPYLYHHDPPCSFPVQPSYRGIVPNTPLFVQNSAIYTKTTMTRVTTRVDHNHALRRRPSVP